MTLSLHDIVKYLSKIFERKKDNAVSLPNDAALSSDLKRIIIGDEDTPVEISKTELKVKGTINAEAINVNGLSVSTEPDEDSAVITALNNATANELVTVGATTTELDAEANLTFDGDHLSIAATGRIIFDGGTGEHTYITEPTDDKLAFHVGTDLMLQLNEVSDTIVLGASKFKMGTVSGDTVTEFSATDSAYAGMILGYTSLLNDAANTSYSVTASFVTVDATTKITFVAPPSGNVEIFVSVYVVSTATRQLYLGLSDNATYNAIDVTHEHKVYDYTGDHTLNHQWVITGLTAGTSYTYFLGAKSDQAGRQVLHWGGDATGKCSPFIMKSIALPATIYDGS